MHAQGRKFCFLLLYERLRAYNITYIIHTIWRHLFLSFKNRLTFFTHTIWRTNNLALSNNLWNENCHSIPRNLFFALKARSDGKRPDGLPLVLWQRGRCLIRDATCVSTFSSCHRSASQRTAGAGAESAALAKQRKRRPGIGV